MLCRGPETLEYSWNKELGWLEVGLGTARRCIELEGLKFPVLKRKMAMGVGSQKAARGKETSSLL